MIGKQKSEINLARKFGGPVRDRAVAVALEKYRGFYNTFKELYRSMPDNPKIGFVKKKTLDAFYHQNKKELGRLLDQADKMMSRHEAQAPVTLKEETVKTFEDI